MVIGNDYVTPFATLTLALYGLQPFPAEDLVTGFFTESTSTSPFFAQSLSDSIFVSNQSIQLQPFFSELLTNSSFNTQESTTISPFDVGCFS
jgi:hypothetical protein